MNIILLVIYIILMALTVYGAYREGLARGQEKILKAWGEAEDKRLKASIKTRQIGKDGHTKSQLIWDEGDLDPRGRN